MAMMEALPAEKRKRSTLPEDEIEVDVSAPEPPSKKALRKAKKLKTQPAKSETVSQFPSTKRNNTDDDDDLLGASADEAPSAPAQKATAAFSIWVGNLPFSTTKTILQQFLCSNAQPPIERASITRIHVPAPQNAQATRTRIKPQNKGFAYVDFADQQSFTAALALTETSFGGRNLLIKNAKSFEGRPEEKRTHNEGSKTSRAAGEPKPSQPTRRIFVGNLGFDITMDDLRALYAPCGRIVDVHMATFEDSGKCKGFAWVTFDGVEAAQAAVQGWTKVEEQSRAEEQPAEGHDEYDTAKSKKKSLRKWFVNKLHGRPVRCEFAEDATTRYKKRYGKEANGSMRTSGAAAEAHRADADAQAIGEVSRNQYGIAPGALSDPARKRGRNAKEALGNEPQQAAKRKSVHDGARYRTGALTVSTGSKVTFD